MAQPLLGKGVIVTGASMGLGKAVARDCLQAGAHVYICARNRDAIERTRDELQSESGEPRIFSMQADVSDPSSVDSLLVAASRQLPSLLGIVNNAAVQGPTGVLEHVDPTEWLRTIETNLFGTMLCCRAILPILRRAGYGKIINLSGGGGTGPRPRFSAYAASKAAIVRLTETLAEEYAAYNIDVNAVSPGVLNTRMLDQVLDAGPERVGDTVYAQALRQKESGSGSPERAAGLCVFLLSTASNKITGKLISAAWDPWESLERHRAELQQTDIYTLRRIVPQDRGLVWDQM